MDETLEIKKHIKYFERSLQVLPSRYSAHDSNRMTIAFFAVNGLDLLDALDNLKVPKSEMIDWIYALQVLPVENNSNLNRCGFRGSTSIGAKYDSDYDLIPHDSGHVAMTYTAISALLILGDDLSRLDRKSIAAGLTQLQQPNGSFCNTVEGSENDMRFVYCVATVCYMINDFTTINVDKTVKYIVSSLSYEGAFGQGPDLESHGGSTYCAIASLWLFNRLDALSEKQLSALIRWCLMRQQSGFQGRPNKRVDTCYSFWIGATLQLLDSYQLIEADFNRQYILTTQDYVTGGFSKWTECSPDPLHSYMGLAGLALSGEPCINQLFTPLNISQRAVDHLHKLHGKW